MPIRLNNLPTPEGQAPALQTLRVALGVMCIARLWEMELTGPRSLLLHRISVNERYGHNRPSAPSGSAPQARPAASRHLRASVA